jgi:hypothetical protein
MFTGCSLDIHWMFTESSLDVHWMFTGCSLDVPGCSLDVHWMFTECSLDVPKINFGWPRGRFPHHAAQRGAKTVSFSSLYFERGKCSKMMGPTVHLLQSSKRYVVTHTLCRDLVRSSVAVTKVVLMRIDDTQDDLNLAVVATYLSFSHLL